MKNEIDFVRVGISKELKKLRVEKDLTQEELALKSGVNIGTIVRYEQGTVNASLDKLCKILNVYDMNIYIFFKKIYENMYRNNE